MPKRPGSRRWRASHGVIFPVVNCATSYAPKRLTKPWWWSCWPLSPAKGLLSDERYAQNYVAYHAGRGQGPIRIAADLRRRGLAAQLIDAALSGGPDWRALALKVSRAKFGRQPPGSWALKARQARFLLYRGFAADQIRAATGADPEMTEET